MNYSKRKKPTAERFVMRSIIATVGYLVILSACRGTHAEHPWHQRPSLPPVKHSFWRGVGKQPQSVLDEWIEIPSAKYANVRGEARNAAIELLRKGTYVPIPTQQVKTWSDLTADTSSTLKAFLVRGISYNPKYDWTRVFYKKMNRELWIQRICSNGETVLTGLFWTIREAPMVVLLDSPPDRISATAHVGGNDVITTDPTIMNSKPAAFWLVDADYPLN